MLKELFYWLDWTGKDGRPSHSKMVATISWLFGMAWDCWFILHGAPYSFLLAWTSLTFAVSYGLKGLIEWMRLRGGGSVDAVVSEIEARRKSVGGDYEPTD